MGIKLWLDDIRTPPEEDMIWAKTSQEAINVIDNNEIDFISFDHDLGIKSNGTGYTVACHIEGLAALNKIKNVKWAVHSANSVGAQFIIAAMLSAARFWCACGN